MLFSHKPTSLLHVLPHELVWYSYKDGHKPTVLELPSAVFRYLEVIDEPAAKKLLDIFFAQPELHTQKIVIILSDDVIFDAALPTAKGADPTKAAHDFTEAIPLDPAAKAVISTKQQASLFVVGTNKHWLRLIVHAANGADIRIERISPIGSYGITDTKELNPHTVEQLLTPNKTAEIFDFLPLL